MFVGVRVIVGVRVMVGVRVFVGVRVAVGVRVGVLVFVGVRVFVGVGVLVGVRVACTARAAGEAGRTFGWSDNARPITTAAHAIVNQVNTRFIEINPIPVLPALQSAQTDHTPGAIVHPIRTYCRDRVYANVSAGDGSLRSTPE